MGFGITILAALWIHCARSQLAFLTIYKTVKTTHQTVKTTYKTVNASYGTVNAAYEAVKAT